MQQRDFGPLEPKFWQEILRYSWIVLLCSIVGMVLSVFWRKNLPTVGSMEASIYTNIPAEVFNHFAENSEGMKITVTHQGSNFHRVVIEAQDNIEEKFVEWSKKTSIEASQLLGNDLLSKKSQLGELEKKINSECSSIMKLSFERLATCYAIGKESIELSQRGDMSIKTISLKPFKIVPTSLPLRDAFFGFFVGFFISLIILGFGLQLKQVRRTEQ